MRLLCILFLIPLLIFPCQAVADESVKHEKPVKNSKAASQPETAKKKLRRPARPTTSFTPSERIGADQAVAFPVDI